MFFEYPKLNKTPFSQIAKNNKYPDWKCGKVFIVNRETGEKIKKISVTKIYETIKKVNFM